MKNTITKIVIPTLMLLGLPLWGIAWSGADILPYLEFPPKTLRAHHAPFSWSVFIGMGLFVLLVTAPFLFQGLRRMERPGPAMEKVSHPSSHPFPWWGLLGLGLTAGAWIMAWSRFPWFKAIQTHTFTPLWVGYIISINALSYKRLGTCLLLKHPRRFLLLFPVSALFWWFFEYLNRFVMNWHYTGKEFGPLEYFFYATLAFSTVLPAFASTREWLLSFPRFLKRFGTFLPLSFSRPVVPATLVLFLAAVGLAGIGLLPNFLFPLLWISPLLIIVSLQVLQKESHVFSPIARGDWSAFLCAALAALMCGFFWEMWNYYSFAKWQYQVPFVNRFRIFEMPVLGYAGYLPFGLECAVIAGFVLPGSNGETPVPQDSSGKESPAPRHTRT